ncbi:MAG: transporter substrate-binding domain-containing protein [Nevskia sp.]|nr:transporter substrate-binding domain-containing protein [Nevskia sp.]
MLLAALAVSAGARAADQELWDRSTLNAILKRGELRVGLEAGYVPFEVRDRQGNIIGFDVDLAKKMASELKVKVSFVNTQWDGIIPALLTDKFDILMSGMTITAERNIQVNFAKPYIVVGQTILLAKRLVGKVRSYQDLDDPQYTVVTKLGTSGETACRRYLSKAHIRTYETEADAAMEVRNGRADAFVYDLPFNSVYVAQYPDSLVHLKEPFTHEPLGWAIRKGDPDFLNWLDNFLDQIRNDGTYDVLYRRWFEGTLWMKNING